MSSPGDPPLRKTLPEPGAFAGDQGEGSGASRGSPKTIGGQPWIGDLPSDLSANPARPIDATDTPPIDAADPVLPMIGDPNNGATTPVADPARPVIGDPPPASNPFSNLAPIPAGADGAPGRLPGQNGGNPNQQRFTLPPGATPPGQDPPPLSEWSGQSAAGTPAVRPGQWRPVNPANHNGAGYRQVAGHLGRLPQPRRV